MEFLLIIIIAIVGMIVQSKLNSVFDKYSRILSPGGLTGAEIAEKMLRDNGIRDVRVTCIKGRLTDHYNPVDKTLNLSEGVYRSNSVAAAAVAAHECGHALQHAEGYAPLRLRSALVPMVQISSSLAQIVIILGILLMKSFPALYWVGIAMFLMVFIFSVVTLPVEYNASKRATTILQNSGLLSETETYDAKKVLNAAALTYVAALVVSILNLLRFILAVKSND